MGSDLTLGLLMLAAFFTTGELAVVTSNQTIVTINPSLQSDVTLECVIEFGAGEKLLRNPIVWTKNQDGRQFSAGQRDYRVNPVTVRLSNLEYVEPNFRDTGRYTSRIIEEPRDGKAVTVASIVITELSVEDSGWYKCEVEGLGAAKVIELQILRKIDSVSITGFTDTNNQSVNSHSSRLLYYTNRPGYFQCMSVGGYPKPTLVVKIGDQPFTGHLVHDDNTTLIGTQPDGLKTIIPYIRSYTDDFQVRPEDNDQELVCESVIAREGNIYETFTDKRMLTVYYPPDFDCDLDVEAKPKQENFQVQCNITARPLPDVIYWRSEGKDLKPENGIDNDLKIEIVNIIDPMQDDRILTTMTFSEVTNDHFKDYELIAENIAERRSITVKVKQGEAVVIDGSGRLEASVTLTFLSLVCLLWKS